MRIVQQDIKLPVTNNDVQNMKNNMRHGVLLPSTIRCLIVGPSSSGKTNVMLSLIEDLNGLRFKNIYVYSKSLFQPKYQYLKTLLEPIKGISYFEFYGLEDNIPSPQMAKSNSIFIFDDVACDKQNIIKEYFTMARHSGIDTFYLIQTYSFVPKHLIRDNANFLILFKQDNLNLRHVYDDHISTDFTFDKFKEICSFCWKDKYGFIVIDKENEINSGRYRKSFDIFI